MATESTELTTREAELAAGALEQIDQADVILPLVKLTQQTSREVQDDEVESGHFVNSVTGHDYGEAADVVVVQYFKGRFFADDDIENGKAFVATGDVVPSNWPDIYAGQRFADIPDAEETFKRLANDPDSPLEWGSGPPIQTTYNYVGFTPDEPGVPLRFSLKRSSTPAARKINTLLRFARAPWDATVHLSTVKRADKQGRPFYIIQAVQGRQTTSEERQAAVELSGLVQDAAVKFAGDDADDQAQGKAKPAAAEGALDL